MANMTYSATNEKNKSKLISAGEAPPSQFPTADDLSHRKNFKHQAKNSIEQYKSVPFPRR